MRARPPVVSDQAQNTVATTLPDEIWLNILQRADLDPLRLYHFGKQSKALYRACKDNSLWEARDEDKANLVPSAARGDEFYQAARKRLNALEPAQKKTFACFVANRTCSGRKKTPPTNFPGTHTPGR